MELQDRKGVPLEVGQEVMVQMGAVTEGIVTEVSSLVTKSKINPGAPDVHRVIVTVPVLLEVQPGGSPRMFPITVTAGQTMPPAERAKTLGLKQSAALVP